MIKVKTLTGKEIEIDIEPTDIIDCIKEHVEERDLTSYCSTRKWELACKSLRVLKLYMFCLLFSLSGSTRV